MNDDNTVMMGEPAAEIVYDMDGHPVGGYPDEADIAEPVADMSSGAIEADANGAAADLPKRARRKADGSITLPLRFPVSVKIKNTAGQIKDEHYQELIFHYLTGGDVRAIQTAKPDMVNIIAFARACKMPQAVMNVIFDKLHIADINDGAKIMAFFTEGGA